MASDDKPCADCAHSSKWGPWYPDLFLVCNAPQALARLGGPRSCYDLVRVDGGMCGASASLWMKKQ